MTLEEKLREVWQHTDHINLVKAGDDVSVSYAYYTEGGGDLNEGSGETLEAAIDALLLQIGDTK